MLVLVVVVGGGVLFRFVVFYFPKAQYVIVLSFLSKKVWVGSGLYKPARYCMCFLYLEIMVKCWKYF